jgi:NADPH-dependent F420 reductase
MDDDAIAIIGGTGKEGTGLALRWASVGYKILIGSREAEKAKKTADDINLRLGTKSVEGFSNADAVKKVSICVLTVIPSAHMQILDSLRGDLAGKILVDATARVDFHDPRPPDPPCAAQLAQDFLGSSVRVVAALQNVPFKLLYKYLGQPMDVDVLVCSDDLKAAESIIQLVNAAGMRGYFAGLLANGIIVEGLTSILISMNRHYGVKDTSINVTGVITKRETTPI